MQEVGAEWGVTTGRRRRCGWLDLVVLKFSNLINGYDSLNLTKLDVLDGFEEIQIGVGYEVDGKELDAFPGALVVGGGGGGGGVVVVSLLLSPSLMPSRPTVPARLHEDLHRPPPIPPSLLAVH
jgi:hypothetical protein